VLQLQYRTIIVFSDSLKRQYDSPAVWGPSADSSGLQVKLHRTLHCLSLVCIRQCGNEPKLTGQRLLTAHTGRHHNK